MDDAVKRELIRAGVPSVVVPIVRLAVQNHYTMKQLDRQEEMEVKLAERRNEGMRELARAKGGGAAVRGRMDPVALENPGDVYDELEDLRTQTDCGFCHDVIGKLMDAPPREAKAGYEELRSYVREVERIRDRDISEGEAEQVVTELVDRWETVPKYVSGLA